MYRTYWYTHTHMCAELLRPSSSMVRKPVPQRQDAVTTLLSRLFLGLPRAGKIGPHAVRAWSSFMYRQAASCKPCCKPRPSWHKLDLGMWSLAEIESFYRRTLSSFVKSIPMKMWPNLAGVVCRLVFVHHPIHRKDCVANTYAVLPGRKLLSLNSAMLLAIEYDGMIKAALGYCLFQSSIKLSSAIFRIVLAVHNEAE